MALPADLINLATNPTAASLTGYAGIVGTGGTAAASNQTTAGYSGNNFNRITWSVATTAVSGGMSYTQTGLAASTTYGIGIWVRASKAQTVNLSVAFQTAAAATVNTITSASTALVANTWTRLSVVGTSGAAVDRAVLTVAAATGGALWAAADTLDLDAVLIAKSTIARTNLIPNPQCSSGWSNRWSGGGTAATSYTYPTGATAVSASGSYVRKTWTGGAPTTNGDTGFDDATGTIWAVPVTPGQSVTFSAYLRASVGDKIGQASLQFFGSDRITQVGTRYYGTNTTLPANTWTRISQTAVVPATAVYVKVFADIAPIGALWAIGNTLDLSAPMVEQTASLATYFDGDTPATTTTTQAWAGAPNTAVSYQGTIGAYFDGTLPPDSSYRYFWTSTANASTSHAEYRGIWVEAVTGPPCPRVQITVSGLGTVAGLVQVTRTADGETWTVPGWYNRSVVDTDTDPDFAVPLNRTVTYTVFFNGAQVGQQSITVTSTTGWVQSPYDPASAMPINTMLTDPAILTLAKGSLEARVHMSNSTRVAAMGAKRPYSIAGQRMADASAAFILHAWKNATSDQFKAMIAQAPILLIRGLPSWGSVPGLAYIDAPAQENNVSRYKNYPNDGLTQWALAGDLVQPVSRKPITGTVTNDQVQTNLAGVTYNTILARSGAKKNVDIKANPLGL